MASYELPFSLTFRLLEKARVPRGGPWKHTYTYISLSTAGTQALEVQTLQVFVFCCTKNSTERGPMGRILPQLDN